MFRTAISIYAVSLTVGVAAVAAAMANYATCVENPRATGATATRAIERASASVGARVSIFSIGSSGVCSPRRGFKASAHSISK
jgi:hypothetical protein